MPVGPVLTEGASSSPKQDLEIIPLPFDDRDENEIGPYKIHKKLAADSFARELKALDSRSGHDVVLKVMNLGHTIDKKSLFSFYREAEQAAKLNHPGIARCSQAATLAQRD